VRRHPKSARPQGRSSQRPGGAGYSRVSFRTS